MDVPDLASRINQEHAGPCHVPGLEVDSDIHPVASYRSSLSIYVNWEGQGTVFS